MEFKSEKRLDQKAQSVLDIMIHRMEQIVPYMPTVDSIETQKFETRDNGQILVLRKWIGSADQAPAAIRSLVSKDMLTWYDEALWTPSEFKVEWKLSSSLGKLYDCGGVNSFGPHPDEPESACLIVISGDLKIYPDRIPGVPGFIARRVAPQVEKFIVKMISPNLTEVVDGLGRYFDAHPDDAPA